MLNELYFCEFLDLKKKKKSFLILKYKMGIISLVPKEVLVG